jgi:hypothetical protein
MRKRIVLATLLTLLATASFAQTSGAKESPAASTTCDLGGGKTIKTDYSSPRMKGRKIYGGLVPFGAVWRTGANEATTFVTTADVTVHDKAVPAGSYTMFTVPDGDKWTLIINKKTGEWGIPYKYESDEFVRIDMAVTKVDPPVENLEIAYDNMGAEGCTLRIDWETTRASVHITAAGNRSADMD